MRLADCPWHSFGTTVISDAMIEVTFLGTSGSIPTKERSLPAIALEYGKKVLLFDCGEGAQRQMMLYSVNMSKIASIFISHIHTDHIVGIIGLIRTLSLTKRVEKLMIYVPKGQERQLQALIEINEKKRPEWPVIIKGIRSGTICKGQGYEVKAILLNHSIKVYGFVFKEADRLRFIKGKCNALGIKGKMFSELQSNGSVVANGKKISINDVTYVQQGKKIAYITDTRPLAKNSKGMKEIENADLLIHEATYSSKLSKLARQRKHSTALEAAMVAKEANAKQLALFHMSARYKDATVLENEAKPVFKKTFAAYDGLKLSI